MRRTEIVVTGQQNSNVGMLHLLSQTLLKQGYLPPIPLHKPDRCRAPTSRDAMRFRHSESRVGAH